MEPGADCAVAPFAAAVSDALVPGTVVGEYLVEHKLGQGGMATVYAARHPVIGKQAAVKVMPPALSADAGAVSRFVLEARAVNRIGHPNIVDVFSFGRLPDGRCYLVMEWLKGETLFERIWRQHGPLPLAEVVHILDEMCCALEAAHHEGIVHRDLKPANVFLCADRRGQPRVKLLDFGVAKLLHTELPPHTTAVGCVVGTPEYVSPEQARARDVTAASDLYSLGVIAYEMVLGRLPFLSDNPADAIQMHLSALPPKPRILWPEIPPPLERLLLGLLEKDASRRPRVAEVRAILEELRPSSSGVPVLAVPSQTLTAPSRPRVRARSSSLLRSRTSSLSRSVITFARRRRTLVRLAAVATAFVLLCYLGYRPVAESAQRSSRAGAPTAVATRALGTKPGSPTAPAVAPGAAIPPAALIPPAQAAKPARQQTPASPSKRAKRRYRDANYLLDPFVK